MYIAIRDSVLLEVFPNVVEGAKYLNINHIEFRLNNNFSVANLESDGEMLLETDEQILLYKEECQKQNLIVSALLTEFDLSMASFEKSVEWFKKAVHIAEALEAKVIRIDSMVQQEHLYTFGKKVELYTNVFSEVIAETDDTEIEFGLENHGREGNNPIFLWAVVKNIDSPRFGLTLDFGNFYWRGYPLSETETILKLLATYTKHTHIKNIAYPKTAQEIYREVGWEYDTYVCPIFQGDINIESVLIELKNADYNNVLCIEDESLHHYSDPEKKKEILQKDAEFLIEIMNDIQFDN
ncbi:MAG TPA: sugar phosphate isomerase/epimerase family protein [Candidatus Hydrogenedens sp.]|nr:sugar phosphate isomerase/epimerase [Candidatus Hydrogenedens sp.]HPP59573.1 sugar phosphate isomerase/epimerase family protein [Candidatus Hydrogenedens sp.]